MWLGSIVWSKATLPTGKHQQVWIKWSKTCAQPPHANSKGVIGNLVKLREVEIHVLMEFKSSLPFTSEAILGDL